MFRPSCDIRTVHADQNQLAEQIARNLDSGGYVVSSTIEAESHGRVTITSKNEIRSPWKLFKENLPQIVHFRLEQKEHNEIVIETEFESHAWYVFFLACLNIAFTCLGVALYLFLALRVGGVDHRVHVISIVLLIGGLAFAGWMRFVFLALNAQGNVIFIEAFYKNIQNTLGVNARVIQRPHLCPHCSKFISFTFVCFLLATSLLFDSNLSSKVTFFLLFGFILSLCCIQAANIFGRGTTVVTVLHSTVFFGVYGAVLFAALKPLKLAASIFESQIRRGVSPDLNLSPYLLEVAVLLGCIIFPTAFLLSLFSFIKKIIPELDLRRSREIQPIEPEPVEKYCSYFVVGALWIFSIGVHAAILYISLSLLEPLLFGKNVIFQNAFLTEFHETFVVLTQHWHPNSFVEKAGVVLSNPAAERFAESIWKVFVFVYTLPVLFLFGALVVKNLSNLLHYFRLLRSNSGPENTGDQFNRIQEIARNISAYTGIKPPAVRIVNSEAINAYVVIPKLPLLKEILVLTEGAVTKLPSNEIAALIAHEIGHIRARHVAYFSLLDFLSAWTFLGEGYVTVLFANPFHLEEEADTFAVRYLDEERLLGRQALIQLLTLIEKEKIKAYWQASELQGLSVSRNDHMDWLPSTLRYGLSHYPGFGPTKKLSFNFRLFYFLCYNGWLAYYTHLPFDERVMKIKSMETP